MLRLNDISKTFHPGTADAKLALDHLSLHVRPGDFISIIGANGAGKSTLFNAICGSFFTDTGTVYLDGKNITMMPEHKRAKVIGRLFQDPMRGSAPDMSIEENLALAAGNGGWLSHISAADKKAFRERLSLLGMGLEDRMKQPVGLLSGGQRQALTLLMATYHVPKVLLLDEHTAALDPGTAEKVQALLALGDLSLLDARIAPDADEKHGFAYGERAEGVTVAYHRDGGEPLTPAQHHRSMDALKAANWDIDWFYLFDAENGAWLPPVKG